MVESPRRFATRVLLLGACLAAGGVAGADPSGQGAPAAEAKVTTTIADLKSLKDSSPAALRELLWPAGSPLLPEPRVVTNAKGDRSLTVSPPDLGCKALLDEGEPAFRAKDYPTARKGYRKAVEQFPRCGIAVLFLGDSYFFAGDAAEGARWYQRAIELNPDDYRGYFYRGNARIQLGQRAEALADFARALAIQPRAWSVSKVLQQNGEALGVDYSESLFTPRAVVRVGEGDSLQVLMDPAGPAHWLGWALCKAVQLSQREAGKRKPGGHWSAAEELECLETLLETYQSTGRSAAPEPELDRLLEIQRSGFLLELAMYEMGSRVAPVGPVLLPLDQRERMVELGRRFVIPVKKAPAP